MFIQLEKFCLLHDLLHNCGENPDVEGILQMYFTDEPNELVNYKVERCCVLSQSNPLDRSALNHLYQSNRAPLRKFSLEIFSSLLVPALPGVVQGRLLVDVSRQGFITQTHKNF